MREILFKAKRIDNGEWVEGNVILSDDACDDFEAIIIPKTDSNMFTKHSGLKEISCDLGFEKWHKVDKNTICQYTGLTDKNGNKIWENDVVKEESCGYVGVVKYVDCEYLIDWNDFPYIRRDMMFWVEERGLKVIGTKFDNPELLGG